MKICYSLRLAALPLALTSVLPVFAQSGDTVVALAETIVTASRNAQPLGSAILHATVLNRDDIAASQAPDLVTLLQREAGLQRTQNGGVGTVSTVFMRGAAALQTLILIDGVPQNKQDASGAVSLEHIMLDMVERVEFVRGNVSAIYGSGAIGGVIQIFTRAGSREPSARVSMDLGPRASRKLALGLSTTVGDTSINLGASRLSTDGFSTINPAQQAGANPDADGYTNTTLNVALTHQIAKGHSVGARLTKVQADTAYDNAFGAPIDRQQSSTRLTQAALFSDNTWGNWRSRLTLSEQSDEGRFEDNGLFGSIDTFRTRATVLNWVNTVAVGGDWLATAGLERQWQGVDTASSSPFGSPYDVRRVATAVFGGFEGQAGPGALQLNVRHDEVGALTKTSGFLGYGYPLNDHLKLTGSVATAFNAPPLGYLFAPGFGNPALRPELARSIELGVQYQTSSRLLRATYFDTRITDQLDYDRVSSAFANLKRTRNSGLEISYKAGVGNTDLRSSLTLQNPVDDVTGQALGRRARTLASIGALHTVGAWRVGADLRYSGSRADAYADPATFRTINTTLDAYTTIDLTLAFKVRPDVELRARLENLGNSAYQTVYGYNQTPRSLFVGLTWTPKL